MATKNDKRSNPVTRVIKGAANLLGREKSDATKEREALAKMNKEINKLVKNSKAAVLIEKQLDDYRKATSLGEKQKIFSQIKSITNPSLRYGEFIKNYNRERTNTPPEEKMAATQRTRDLQRERNKRGIGI